MQIQYLFFYDMSFIIGGVRVYFKLFFCYNMASFKGGKHIHEEIKIRRARPAVLLALLGLVLIWRAFYGVNYNDEMYYADCRDRLYRGDVYLVQDWQMHLMSMIPVYPFYVLFRLVRESMKA